MNLLAKHRGHAGLRRLCRPPEQKCRSPLFDGLTRTATAVGLTVPLLLAASPAAHAGTIGTSLVLQNLWTDNPLYTHDASITSDGTIVSFSGAVDNYHTDNPQPVSFTLPPSYRPSTDVYVHVELCGTHNGSLHIVPDGTVTVVDETDPATLANARCFTSLDSASFARSSNSTFTTLTLQNGWTNAPLGTSNAQVRKVAGVVQFKGAIAGGSTNQAFVLAAGLRPAADTYVPIGLGNGAKGRLRIRASDGAVFVEAESFPAAQSFTSLDGASYVPATMPTPLTLKNGWTGGPLGTRLPSVQNVSSNGIIRFEGAMATSGTNPLAFTLGKALRPTADVYLPIDLCGAHNGWLHIEPDGNATVVSENNDFSKAQCLTSLDGAWYTLGGYAPLVTQNGWHDNLASSSASSAAAELFDSVTFRGTIATSGTNPVALTLPVNLRPTKNVYAPVDLSCGGEKGRLFIQPNGVVTVQAEGNVFSNAQCSTSLEGVSFPLPGAKGFIALPLVNGWTGGPFGTSAPAAKYSNKTGLVTFKGAVAGGSTGLITTLPASMRPSADVYVPIDLCGAVKGRLLIQPSGDVTVQARTSFSDAHCFTSLDGATFDLNNPQPLTLQNGWTGTPFGTRSAASKNEIGVVRFSGAIAGGSSGLLFTLPADQRPTARKYIHIDLCDAKNGELYIDPVDGKVSVLAEGGDLGAAQCFTSLEGAWFVQ